MISLLFSTMLFTSVHVTPHVTPHVTTHISTPHVSNLTNTTRTPARNNIKTETPAKSNFAKNTNMSSSGYETSDMWRNMFIFHMMGNATDHSYTLRIKDNLGRLHTVHLTRSQYNKVTNAHKVLWKNRHVYADGHVIN